MKSLQNLFRTGLLIVLLTPWMLFSQSTPGCPSVDAGSDVYYSCNGGGTPTTLTASLVTTKQTTSYSVASIPYAPFPYTAGTSVLVSQDDLWSGVVDMPFNFCFFGNTFNKLVMGANGHISFDLTYAGATDGYTQSTPMPNTTQMPGNTINAVFRDLVPGGAGTMKYNIYGQAPCRSMVISWSKVNLFSCTTTNSTIQIVLYEGTNFIDVYIENSPSCAGWQNGNGTIGIQNGDATSFVCPPNRNLVAFSATNEAWRFTPTGASNFTFNWYDVAAPTVSLGTGLTLNVNPSSTKSYMAKMVVTNCDGSTISFSDVVTVNITPPITISPVSASVCLGATQQLTPSIVSFTNPADITGGTISFDPNGNKIHTFSSGGNFVIPANTNSGSVEALVVGGGGSGGYITTAVSTATGGGGGGGVVYNAAVPVATGSYPVTVGAGGTGNTASVGNKGGNSTFGATITAFGGGGGGGSATVNGTAGGSGGGGAAKPKPLIGGSLVIGTAGAANTTSSNSAGNGGAGTNAASGSSGGGGGAGTAGSPGVAAGASGGNGLLNNITGFAAYYGGGGGGCVPGALLAAGASGEGGLGGGGDASGGGAGTVPENGQTNSGGGGGGVGSNAISPGGDGGSGVVIVKYPIASFQTTFTGTWSSSNTAVATVNSSGLVTGVSAGTATISYTFSNGCAGSTTITVTGKVTPTFTVATNVCTGGTAPTLPSPSNEGITGVWTNLPVSNTATTTYTFTPAATECANSTTITITVGAAPTPTFDPIAAICSGATAPTLQNPSNEGINGVWTNLPVSNTATTTYTFTPNAGECGTSTTFTITVTPKPTPTFNPIAAICSGATAPTLQDPSNEGINGVWTNLPVSNTATTAYTFTPNAGVCANTATITVTVTPKPTPTFNPIAAICSGDPAPTLPNPSNEGINGVWTNLPVSNTATTTYTFTPSGGVCANSATITVTVNPKPTPTFNSIAAICSGDPAPSLQNPSNEGINGVWTNLPVSNTATTVYTFTPNAGVCANTATITVTVNPKPTPTFNSIAAICSGDPAPSLQNPSNEGINGVWTNLPVSNTATTVYTFTPNTGVCATTATITVTVNPKPTPTFNPITAICSGDSAPSLQNPSNEGINGVWTNLPVSNTATTVYTFTPNAGVCANTATITVTVNPKPTPTFNPIPPICGGGTAPTLQKPSNEGITGNWEPPTVDNTVTRTYVFTPTTGLCAETAQIIITVGPPSAPVFTPVPPFCEGLSPAPTLPHPSNNGVTGIWEPSNVNTTTTTTYLFTPTAGLCATTTDMTIVVNPKQNPTFPAPATYCKGDVIPALPVPSNEGITGDWEPAPNNQNTTTYTFTPASTECANSTTLTITVNPPTTPLFAPIPPICAGQTAPVLPLTSTNGISGTWDETTVDNMVTKTYTFTPNTGQCAETTTLTVTVNPGLTVTSNDVTTCANVGVQLNVTGGSAGAMYSWTPAGTLIGANTQTPTATVSTPTTYTVTVTDPTGCNGTATATVSISSALSVAISPSAPNICAGGCVNLTVSPAGATSYTWTPTTGLTPTTGSTVSACPTTTQTYVVDVNNNGCIGQGTVTVTVGPPTPATFTQIPPFCAGTTAPILPVPSLEGVDGTWSSTVNNTTTSTYTFTPTAGACATGTTMTITVNPTPTLGTVTATCDGTNTNYVLVVDLVGGTPGFVATANAPSTGITGTPSGNTWTSNPILSGTSYNIDFKDANGCGPVNVTGIKNCNCATAVGTMANTPISICQGATATATYTATGENFDANDVKQFVLHTNAGGTLGTIITRSATPSFTFGAGMTYGTTYYISAIVGDNSGGGTVDINDPCLAVAIGQPVVWNATPTTTASNNGPVCIGATLTVSTPTVAGASCVWTLPDGTTSTQQNLSFPSATAANAGTYSLIITVNGCPSAAVTTTAVVNPIPVATPSNNGPICQGATLNLTAATVPGATSYNWSNAASGFNSTTQNPSLVNATLANAGTYNLTVTVGTGAGACTSPAVGTTVVINPTVTLTASASKTTICANDPVGTVLTGTGGTPANYQWTPVTGLTPASGIGNNVTAKPNTATTYVLSDPTALCSNTASVTINVDPVPVMANVADLAACDGITMNVAAFTMTPTGGTPATTGFTWVNPNTSIGLGPNGNGNIPPFKAVGTGVPGTNNLSTIVVTPTRNGCKGIDETIVITVYPLPIVLAEANAPCVGSQLDLKVTQPNGGQSYNWTGPNGYTASGQTPSKPNVVAGDAGVYTVNVVDINTCPGTSTVTVSVQIPSVPTLTNIGPFCENISTPQNIPVDATVPGDWSSTIAGAVVNNQFIPSVATEGTHTLTYTPTATCAVTGTIDVTVNPMPVIAAITGGTGCGPLTVNFTPFNPADLTTIGFGDGTSSNVTTPTISNIYSNSGNYDVTVSQTTNGCTTTQTFEDIVYVEPNPVASFNAKNQLLYLTDPTAVFINNSTGAATYAWDFGDNTTSTTTNPTHTYDEIAAKYTISLTATSAAGCVDATSVAIQIKDELLFFVPNTFTPDGDQHNNSFQPVFTSGFDPQNFTMYIYNRWGEIVFETHNVEVGWDGTFKGEIVREGIYQWTMEVKDPGSDNKYDFQGHILLTR